jgi:predicted permease
MMFSLTRDLRLACRMLAARPAWTAAAVLCLAIASGASTAAFALVNGLLLRPLPFDNPNELVMVALREPSSSGPRPFSLVEYRDLATRSGGASALLARTYFPLSLSAEDGARMAQAELVSGNYFETLRLRPFRGRFFDASDDRDGAPVPAVLSHRLWQLRFGSSDAAIGQTVRVNGRPVTIAAVAPPGFTGAMQLVTADVWLPAALYPSLARDASAATVPMFGVMGRLVPGVTIADAEARLTAAMGDVGQQRGKPALPVLVRPAAGFGVPIAVAGTVLTLSRTIYLMMALLMAVACANVGALVLARGADRMREMAIRLTLGASRRQIAVQLLAESLVLAVAGGALGTLVGLWLTQTLVAQVTTPFEFINYAIDVRPDVRVLLYSALATTATIVLCAIAPVRLAGRVPCQGALKRAADARPPAAGRALNALVAAQFAVSTTLLAAAGMLIRTYVDGHVPEPAFDTRGLLAVTLDVDQIAVDRADGERLVRTAAERLSRVGSVTSVGLTRDLPIRSSRAVTIAGSADGLADSPRNPVQAAAMAVDGRYFDTLGLRHQGRVFDDRPTLNAQEVVINEALARRLWPGSSALGRTLRLNRPDADPVEVIGVVTNGTRESLVWPPREEIYQPLSHAGSPRTTILLRVSGELDASGPAIRQAVREVHADLAIADLRALTTMLSDADDQRRLPAAVLTLIALLGLLLTAVGLFGVVMYRVRERTRELGIRLALGASPAGIRRLVLQQGFRIVGVGVVVGFAGTAVLGYLARSMVFGARPVDPATFAGLATLLGATASVALYLPARWASKLDPARTLRGD